jgi:hypothetical protein
MQSTSSKPFEPLVIPRKEVPKSGSRYRVYRDSRNYTVVAANSAAEALEQYGDKNVHKLVRETLSTSCLLDISPDTADKSAISEEKASS